jgi:hypothetical protein
MRAANGSVIASAALCLVSADDVHRLRRQADMRHDGNAALDKIADRFRHAPAPLDLHRSAVSFLHDAGRVAEGDRRALLVGAERHVDDDECALGAAHHRAPVHDHQLKRHRYRRLVAVHDHAETVADQQEVAVAIGDRRGVRVIGGESDDGPAPFHGGDVGSHEALLRGMDGHGGKHTRFN